MARRELIKPTLRTKFITVSKEIRYAFLVAMISILSIELLFKNFPAPSDVFFKLGEIYLKVCYSIVPASIFFFLNQHLPKLQKKFKSLLYVSSKTNMISQEILFLIHSLRIVEIDGVSEEEVIQACAEINPSEPVFAVYDSEKSFENWYYYIEYKSLKIRQIIRDLQLMYDLLDTDLLEKLSQLDSMLNILLFSANIKNHSFSKNLQPYAGVIYQLIQMGYELDKILTSNYKHLLNYQMKD